MAFHRRRSGGGAPRTNLSTYGRTASAAWTPPCLVGAAKWHTHWETLNRLNCNVCRCGFICAGARPAAAFPVVTSHAKLIRYLRDQGELQLDVVSDSGPLGVATLGEDLVSAIELGYPYNREIAVKGAWTLPAVATPLLLLTRP